MKISVASLGKKIDSEISPQAGRAPYYLIFNDNELIETWKNVFAQGGGGAGLAVAKVMSDKGVGKVIVANLGDKMKVALQEKNIEFEEKQGLIKDIIS